ncbi:MAG: histidine phosphatase family protein [Nocardioidaceae bacterium]|nr:histidine phosphatase family protein [Nocardioidaceae bacterium]
MTRLVLVRHGRTAWNAQGRAQGHTDIGLDEVGRAQAEVLAPYVVAMAPSTLWSSDLTRARQTATVLAEATGLALRTDERLREFDSGERSGLTVAEFAEQYPAEHAAWKAGHITGNVPGAESPDQVVARMVPALREIWDATPEGETTVLVSHGACLKVSLAAFLGWPEEVGDTLRGLDNCGWAVLEQDALDRPIRLASYNETAQPGVHSLDAATESPLG